MLEAALRTASQNFVVVITACLEALEALQQQGANIAGLTNLAGFQPYTVAKDEYIVAFEASLAEVEGYQAQGVAHYEPAYLLGAQTFIASVMGAELDHITQIPLLIQRIVDYTNLYHTGRWTNVFTWLQQRAVNNWRASFIGWFTHGAVANQSVDMDLKVSFVRNDQVQSTRLKVGRYWPLINLKEELKDLKADGQAEDVANVAIRGSGGILTPDTKLLAELGIKDGDSVTVDFPGAGSAFG
jgi:hypothetical protein